MTKIHAIAHTHWDFEWYFTRQEARVQFAFHMDDVFDALAHNQLDYYLLDGQMSIIDDYLAAFPEQQSLIQKFVRAGRLFIGPWYTQIDEMVTSGESIVRNLRLGMRLGDALGGVMKVGYLPDSFGQNQDMPKIYNGFDIHSTVFWRGFPSDNQARYFYWDSNDGSQVIVANLKNGYYAGVDLIENNDPTALLKRITTQTTSSEHVLPVGGDQRAIDFNLKEQIQQANQTIANDDQIIESTYPNFFKALSQENNLPSFSGEFIDPSDSKIHRGIYSSRYDLKQLYDALEQTMTYQIEPLMAIATHQGIKAKQGLIDEIWQTIARGQAHDSSGGCNSDKTNQDIYHRGITAKQTADSLKDYLLRKLSISIDHQQTLDLLLWNPLPLPVDEIREVKISTKTANFKLYDLTGQAIAFEVLNQTRENAATLRRNPAEMTDDYYFVTQIAFKAQIGATDWTGYYIALLDQQPLPQLATTQQIENSFYQITNSAGQLNLLVKETHKKYPNFLTIEDGGDEGDTYDFSPAFADWLLTLDFAQATTCQIKQGQLVSQLQLAGQWQLPIDLTERQQQNRTGKVKYQLTLKLYADSPLIQFELKLDNQVLDHRMRLVLNTDIQAQMSYADTPFGTIQRPVEDAHLNDWQSIGYHEEPTSMRPMIHFANIHNEQQSWTFLTTGMKDFQVIGDRFNQLAITLFRGVGYLGRPDLKRRPSDASGLQTKVVATPDSQLTGQLTFTGALLITPEFNPVTVQRAHLQLSQTALDYQIQTINRFTTPLQYFMMNPTAKPIQHAPLLTTKALQVTFSSFANTVDGAGWELRLYNPTNQTILAPGVLAFKQTCRVAQLDLRGHVQTTLTNTDNYSLPAFKPGEIRTYGIYPIHTTDDEVSND